LHITNRKPVISARIAFPLPRTIEITQIPVTLTRWFFIESNALNFQRKFFPRTVEQCPRDLSEIFALEIKGEFSAIRNLQRLSASIGRFSIDGDQSSVRRENTVSLRNLIRRHLPLHSVSRIDGADVGEMR
jgi:hypothetical protein